MERYLEFIGYLRSNGADSAKLNAAHYLFEEFHKWDKGGTVYDQLMRRFGLNRSLYILVSTLNELTYRKARKGEVMTAMRELGFRQEIRHVCGVQLRVWVRGRWTNEIPAYQAAPEVPPCPVPPPPY